ncbi:MAG TPA: META domain-containing protein [Chitinophagales bacterium]|jgi:heat shock protein HslJ|nr:META domain-containing protein [Chitinophagales bacterium]MBP6154194.1 META domain-containing protein [Chitinophagales bacterium]HQV78671.1 META domain-containing protein [Chitinophagales bacterium]HQW78943.1 META domain-containing protein [Chitinophagales bacterium]HRB19023.1 META domain-containing protein [Chitinophagales bacterium]
MKIIPFIFFLIFSQVSIAGEYLKIVYVADFTQELNGISYLMIRETPTDSFSMFKDSIRGFTFEKGNSYCLLTEVIKDDLGQSIYVLNEIKWKQKTDSKPAKMQSIIPDSSKWILYKLRMADGTKTFSISKAFLQFNILNSTVLGSSDCNSFNADFSIDSTTIKIDNIIATKMACNKRSIEPAFMQCLQKVTSFKVTKNLLYFYQGNKLIALFTKKQKNKK